jgi:hypothetical protein
MGQEIEKQSNLKLSIEKGAFVKDQGHPMGFVGSV